MNHKQEHLENSLQAATESNIAQEERYDSLKAHAQGQIEKSNRELILMNEHYEDENF